MAGINHDIDTIRAWLEAGVVASGLTLKRPDNVDDGGHSYSLVAPGVFAHAYPTNQMEDALPSVLLELESVSWTREAVVYELSLTLAVWDSGIHAPDVFHATDTPGEWTKGTGNSYERADGSKGATLDLCTLAEVISRHCRRGAMTIGDGLQLDLSEGLALEIISDDELSRSGFRFGRFSLVVRDPLPPAPSADTIPTADREADDNATTMEITSFL